MSLALCVVATAAFQLPSARLPTPATVRTDPARMISLPQVAAGANLATFAVYGGALLLKPGTLMKEVMKSDEPAWKFADIPYALAQYLGAIYLSQALRMFRALTTAAMLRTDLMGVGVIQLFLCL